MSSATHMDQNWSLFENYANMHEEIETFRAVRKYVNDN